MTNIMITVDIFLKIEINDLINIRIKEEEKSTKWRIKKDERKKMKINIKLKIK